MEEINNNKENEEQEYLKYLDDNQINLYKKFNAKHYLSKKEHLLKIFMWTTFYRLNFPAFITHYFKLKLHLYQIISLYVLSLFNYVAIIASRATAKSWLIAVFACAKAVLYPNSLIVICSATKGQSKLIISAKIQGELMRKSPTLCNEIDSIKSNSTETIVMFKNGSTITVVPASDNGRGYRSTLSILEEFRQIKKHIKDSVITPFSVCRDCDYFSYPEYENLKKEEPSVVEISSSWRTNHWIWEEINDLFKGYCYGESTCVLAMDYSVSLKHGIKSVSQLLREKSILAPITWRIEYENEMLKENTNAYFTYSMLENNQNSLKAFYPRTNQMAKKDKTKIELNPYYIQKQTDEIRLLSADIAFVNKSGNDNSCYTLMRLLPEIIKYESSSIDGKHIEIKNGYRRVVSYIEAIKGCDVDVQAIRLKQLYYDFGCDYTVLDARNGGRNAIFVRNYKVIKLGKKTETLKCQSEWKALFKSKVTRNAYKMKLHKQNITLARVPNT